MSEAPVSPFDALQVEAAFLLDVVPTSVYSLYLSHEQPLARVRVRNVSAQRRTVQVSCLIQELSVAEVTTQEIEGGSEVSVPLRPVLRRQVLDTVGERTPASVYVRVVDLNSGLERWGNTYQVTLLSRNSAPIRIAGNDADQPKDLLPLLGAFVTPNDVSIQDYLETVKRYHPLHQLKGYLALGSPGDSVRSQVRAIYRALSENDKLSYAVSGVERLAGCDYQRVRMPSQCLKQGLANCLEGVLLFCSCLQAIWLQSAIVWTPEHAVVAWKEDPLSDSWRFLDTTKVGPQGELPAEEAEEVWAGAFEQAMQWGRALYEENKDKGPDAFRILPIRNLRAQGITPLE